VSRVVLLDGGMGQELIRRAPEPPSDLWSAMVMHRHPDLVRDLHVDFIRAGARVITVNSYAATRDRLARFGLEGEFEKLQRLACRLAHEAREEVGIEGVRIAGCLPPLKASYRWEDADPPEITAPVYREIVELQAPHVDLFICETMASIRQAEGALGGVRGCGRPVWLAFTVDDRPTGRLRSGESMAEALAAIRDKEVAAVLLNCSTPEGIAAALPGLAGAGRPWGAYPNGFPEITEEYRARQNVSVLAGRPDLTPERFAGIALGWVRDGATIVGGCCEIGPAHIAALAAVLTEAGYEIGAELEKVV